MQKLYDGLQSVLTNCTIYILAYMHLLNLLKVKQIQQHVNKLCKIYYN